MLYNPLAGKKIHTRPIMQSEDMFYDNMVQVFSRKTGEYLGYIYRGTDPEVLQEKIEAEPVPAIPVPVNQLNLF
jgi:hypothetical protein